MAPNEGVNKKGGPDKIEDRTNADGVLVAKINTFFWINHVTLSCTVHILLLDVEVTACFLHVVSIGAFASRLFTRESWALTSQQT
jgi:hypothetical protein